jgi:hypothetical protein
MDADVYRGDIGDVYPTRLVERLNQIGDRRDPGDTQIATLLLPERVIWRDAYDLDSSSERPLGRSCWRTLGACARSDRRSYRHGDVTSPASESGLE